MQVKSTLNVYACSYFPIRHHGERRKMTTKQLSDIMRKQCRIDETLQMKKRETIIERKKHLTWKINYIRKQHADVILCNDMRFKDVIEYCMSDDTCTYLSCQTMFDTLEHLYDDLHNLKKHRNEFLAHRDRVFIEKIKREEMYDDASFLNAIRSTTIDK